MADKKSITPAISKSGSISIRDSQSSPHVDVEVSPMPEINVTVGTDGKPGKDGRSVRVFGPSDLPPPIETTDLRPGDVWLSNGVYDVNDNFDPSIVDPGPAGRAAWIGPAVNTASELPSPGEPAELRFVRDTGSIFGWDEKASTWVNGGVIRVQTLAELHDVDSTPPVDGDTLVWDGQLKTWRPSSATGGLHARGKSE